MIFFLTKLDLFDSPAALCWLCNLCDWICLDNDNNFFCASHKTQKKPPDIRYFVRRVIRFRRWHGSGGIEARIVCQNSVFLAEIFGSAQSWDFRCLFTPKSRRREKRQIEETEEFAARPVNFLFFWQDKILNLKKKSVLIYIFKLIISKINQKKKKEKIFKKNCFDK